MSEESNSFVQDENGCYNTIFEQIIRGEDVKSHKIDEKFDIFTFEEYKEYLTKNFKLYGDRYMYKDGKTEVPEYKEDHLENLYNQILIIPLKEILWTERWGYNRYGTNGTSCDFDISDLTKKSEEVHKMASDMSLKNFSVSLNVYQHTS